MIPATKIETMSSIAFHSPDHDTVRVGGAERSWARFLCTRIMESVLGLGEGDSAADGRSPAGRLLRMVRDDHYIHDLVQSRHNAQGLDRLLRSAMDGSADLLAWNGHFVDHSMLAINTALVIGGDPLRLLARVHGSCEVHGWVDGPNRAWLADIIEEGMASGVLRRAYQTQYENWPGVLAMLRNTSHAPVVMSHSTTESFPSWYATKPVEKSYGEMTDEEQDQLEAEEQAWDELDVSTQWKRALASLQTSRGGLEIRPDDWKGFRFDHRLSAFDLLAEDWESRLDLAFPAPSPGMGAEPGALRGSP